MKKVQRLLTMNDGDERKHVLDYTKVDLHYMEDQRLNLDNESLKDEVFDLKKVIEKWTSSKVTLNQPLSEQIFGYIVHALGGRGKRKDSTSSKDVVFIKAEDSLIENSHICASNDESVNDNHETLPALRKLSGAEPIGTTKRLKEQIKPSSDNSLSVSQTGSSKSRKNKQKANLVLANTVVTSYRKALIIPKPFIPCKYCKFNDHHSDECEYYPGCDICGSIAHEPFDCDKRAPPNDRRPRIANQQSKEPTKKFQSLLSQLEIHGAGVSTEDANQKLFSTNSTNDVSTAYDVSTSSGYNSQRENSSSYTDELMYSFFDNQSNGPQLDHEDLEQLDEFDLEEMNLKWQVAMISMRLKNKFYKKTGRKLQFDAKEPVGFDKTKVKCFNCHKTWHFARECKSKGYQESKRRDSGNIGYKAKENMRRLGKQEEPKSLVTLDGEGVDWTGHAEDEQENFALIAYNKSGSDTEVTSCSKECVESYVKLKKLYDEQREQLGDDSIEIQAYTQALKKVEAQLVVHQKNQLCSSKGLSKLLNSQMSTRDKSGLGYGNQIHEGVISYEKEVLESVFDSRLSDVEDSHVHDRFANVEGMHAVPLPMTGNYIPSGRGEHGPRTEPDRPWTETETS
ncbi:ribonuclease H-like domain-containing protein [Tanacetum coccineum]